MRRADKKAKLEGTDIVIDPENFDVSDDDIPAIKYNRIEGWSEHKKVRSTIYLVYLYPHDNTTNCPAEY
jgi:hypothetical protein